MLANLAVVPAVDVPVFGHWIFSARNCLRNFQQAFRCAGDVCQQRLDGPLVWAAVGIHGQLHLLCPQAAEYGLQLGVVSNQLLL